MILTGDANSGEFRMLAPTESNGDPAEVLRDPASLECERNQLRHTERRSGMEDIRRTSERDWLEKKNPNKYRVTGADVVEERRNPIGGVHMSGGKEGAAMKMAVVCLARKRG